MTAIAGASTEPSLRYRPDVDGLRALAVVSVMLFHARLGCPGGYVGVDVFFVISGFLISSFILDELVNGSFSLIAFWERRVRRIVPVLVTVVLASIVTAWFLYLPHDFKHLGRSVVGQATLTANFLFARDTDYFATGSDSEPLLHTWSLAVEEQFYLVYPLLLLLLTRSRRLSLSGAILALALGSCVACVVGSYTDLPTTFYLLPTRAWLAARRGKTSVSVWMRESAGWLGLGLVACGVFFYDRYTRFPGLAAVPPCLGAALIILSSESKLSRAGRILAFKPAVFIGLVSYSLYLWHWPVLVFSHYAAREAYGAGVRILLLLASAGLACLSWRYVEAPIHKRRILLKRSHVFGLAGVSMATLLGLGLLIYRRDGFPSRFAANTLHYADGWTNRAFLNIITLEQAIAGQFVELGSRDTTQPVDLLIWGDSHAMALTPVLDELCRKFSRRGVQATQVTTAPVLNYVSPGAYSLGEDSLAFNRAVLTFISERRVRNVVIAARWSRYPATDSFKTNLLSTVRAVMDAGARVYVAKEVPDPGFDVPRIAALASAQHADLAQLGITREQHEGSNRELRRTFEEIARMGAAVLDPADLLANRDGRYDVVRDGQVLYWDSHHLTVEGSRLLVPLFEPMFTRE